jgi:WD40 repeat protein
VLLLIDQFEQLFTQCEDQLERDTFIAALHAAATTRQGSARTPPALVVLVVRADFETRLADYPQLTQAVQDRYLLTSMTARQLRVAITQPAVTAGSVVDDDLVRVLLGDMNVHATAPGAGNSAAGNSAASTSAGMLPLLSHALDQAWRIRSGEALTLADYERAGGIEGAVADSAQRAYHRLTSAQQACAKQIFIRLTATGGDGTDTAARAIRADLTAGRGAALARDVEAVLETFAAERLLTLAAGTVEISHEALLTAWPLLCEWLTDTHADRIIRTRLDATAQEWLKVGRDPAYLYGGSRLQETKDAAARIGADPRHTPLSPAESAFLDASGGASRRRVWRRQGVIAALLALTVALAAVAGLAQRASLASARETTVAFAGQLASESLARGVGNETASALESVAAWHFGHSAESRYAMVTAASRIETGTLAGGGGEVYAVAFSPHGSTLATGDWDGTVRLWDMATGQQEGRPLTVGSGLVFWVAFGRRGDTLATFSSDGVARLWNLATRTEINHVTIGADGTINPLAFDPATDMLAVLGNDDKVWLWNLATARTAGNPLAVGSASYFDNVLMLHMAFSPDDTTLATVTGNGGVRLWNLTTRREEGHTVMAGLGPVFSVAFSPDGRTLVTGDWDGTARLWNLATDRPGPVLPAGRGIVIAVAFSRDGRTLATGDWDGTARLWNPATGKPEGGPLAAGTGSVFSVAFSPDGSTLATGDDAAARLWNVAAAKQLGNVLATSRSGIVRAAFSPDGRAVAIVGGDGEARLWNLATGGQVGPAFAVGATPFSPVAFSRDGTMLAVADGDGTVRLWDLVTGRQTRVLPSAGPVYSLAFSPDGTRLATGGGHGQVRLWHLASASQFGHVMIAGSGLVSSLAFSRNGSMLATADWDGTARLWNPATGDPEDSSLAGSYGLVVALAFSPDGRTLATADWDGTARLWNLATGKQEGGPLANGSLTGRPPADGTGYVSLAFSPDGQTLAVADSVGTTRLWDVATSQSIGGPFTGQPTGFAAAFSQNGTTLVTAGNDGTVRQWNVGYLVNPLGQLCARTGGFPSETDWKLYVSATMPDQNVCPDSDAWQTSADMLTTPAQAGD